VRSRWTSWIWENDIVDQLIDGFMKAKALDAAPGSPASSSGVLRTSVSNDSGKTGAIARANPDSSFKLARASAAGLPFGDMSAAKDQDWLCDGVAEEILNALSQLKGLHVAARTSSFSFRGKADDLKAIGDKLKVATVLDGSVRRSGDQVRITVRLSDVANG